MSSVVTFQPNMNRVTGVVVNAAMKVHSLLGPGLLESAYHACLARELSKRGMTVASQVALPVVYEGEKLELGYRIDLVVEHSVVVEVKCVEAIHPVHEAQLLSYMRLSGIPVGLLINFHVARLKDGISPHGGWARLAKILTTGSTEEPGGIQKQKFPCGSL